MPNWLHLVTNPIDRVAVIERALEARRVHLTPEMGEDHPERRAFNVLHERAEGLLKASVIAALVAMFLS